MSRFWRIYTLLLDNHANSVRSHSAILTDLGTDGMQVLHKRMAIRLLPNYLYITL